MTTSIMTGVKYETEAMCLRARIGGVRWLPILFLLATALTVQAVTSGDYIYTITPNGMARIDEYTGSGGEVILPSIIDGRTVIGLGYYAFAGSTNLTGVAIPGSVTYLEDSVFNGCDSLTRVVLGSGVASIGYGAFDNCPKLAAIIVDAGNTTYSSLDGVLFNKSRTTLVEHPEGKAGHYTIPAGVIHIQDYAFESCYNLTGITIPPGVAGIGKQAFWFCTNLPAVTIPSSVTRIGEDAFNQCAGLASVTLKNGLTHIGDSAFYECTRLAGVTIPATVASIGDMAFSRCTRLAAITVDAGSAVYSSLAGVLFNKSQTVLVQCPGGKTGSYTVPNTVTNIGGEPYASYLSKGLGGFSWCAGLTGVTLPPSVTSIGKNAFLYCTHLTSITIPDSVVDIGHFAFENCTGLTRVTLPAGISRIAYWTFAGCAALTDVRIPDSVTHIEAQAFAGCAGLTGLTIPHSVVSIGMGAFSPCTSLVSVAIGRGVVSIDDGAFSGCANLAGIYFRGDAPSVGVDVFLHDDHAIVYYLPGATGWGETFGGRPTALWNAMPEPVIRANGAAGTITVTHPAPVSVTVALDAGNYAGTPVDWWVVAFAHSGEWYYLNSSMQGVPFNGDVAFCRPVYEGGVVTLSSTPVLSGSVLSPGTYDFWFAIDYPMDGFLDVNGQILLDKVTVVVH